MRRLVVIGFVSILSGCAALTNVTVSDLRAERHLAATGEIPGSLASIRDNMAEYERTCHAVGRLTNNPANENEASYVSFMPGWTDTSAALLIDLEQQGQVTYYKGYIYYTTWQRHLDRALRIMSGREDC